MLGQRSGLLSAPRCRFRFARGPEPAVLAAGWRGRPRSRLRASSMIRSSSEHVAQVAEALEPVGHLLPAAVALARRAQPGVVLLAQEAADLGQVAGEPVGLQLELLAQPALAARSRRRAASRAGWATAAPVAHVELVPLVGPGRSTTVTSPAWARIVAEQSIASRLVDNQTLIYLLPRLVSARLRDSLQGSPAWWQPKAVLGTGVSVDSAVDQWVGNDGGPAVGNFVVPDSRGWPALIVGRPGPCESDSRTHAQVSLPAARFPRRETVEDTTRRTLRSSVTRTK